VSKLQVTLSNDNGKRPQEYLNAIEELSHLFDLLILSINYAITVQGVLGKQTVSKISSTIVCLFVYRFCLP